MAYSPRRRSWGARVSEGGPGGRATRHSSCPAEHSGVSVAQRPALLLESLLDLTAQVKSGLLHFPQVTIEAGPWRRWAKENVGFMRKLLQRKPDLLAWLVLHNLKSYTPPQDGGLVHRDSVAWVSNLLSSWLWKNSLGRRELVCSLDWKTDVAGSILSLWP